MATIELTETDFGKTIEENDIVIIDWWASWCGPCMMFAPVYEEVSNENPDICFAKVNTETQQQLSAAAGISSIPTLMIFREKVAVFSQAGALPKDALVDLINQVRKLDMDDVRKSLEDSAKQSGTTE